MWQSPPLPLSTANGSCVLVQLMMSFASSTRSPGMKQLLRTTSFHSVQPTLSIIACRAALGHHSIGSKLTRPLPMLILKRRTWAMYLVVELACSSPLSLLRWGDVGITQKASTREASRAQWGRPALLICIRSTT